MRCTETVVSVQNVLLNGVEDRTILVRSDGDLTLGGVESQLVHSGERARGRGRGRRVARRFGKNLRGRGRRIADRFGENLREGNESEEQKHIDRSHLVQL